MKKVIIKRRSENSFLINNNKQNNLQTLSLFLTEDLGEDISGALLWLYNPKKWSSPGELFWEEFINNNVKISPMYFELPSLTISKDTFLHIIHEWHRIIKTEPKKIIITEKNGKYSFDAEY